MTKYIVDSPKAKLLAIKLGWNFYSPKNNKCISHGVRQKLDECEVILISEKNLILECSRIKYVKFTTTHDISLSFCRE
jgi:hypothetical protein